MKIPTPLALSSDSGSKSPLAAHEQQYNDFYPAQNKIKKKQKEILKAIEPLSNLKDETPDIISGIGVVFNDKNQILLGLCIIKDFRYNTWCFPGGGIDGEENVYQAAIREVEEETGIVTKALPIIPVIDTEVKGATFVILKKTGGEIEPNEEFLEVDWFSLGDLPEKTLLQNVEILEKFRKIIRDTSEETNLVTLGRERAIFHNFFKQR